MKKIEFLYQLMYNVADRPNDHCISRNMHQWLDEKHLQLQIAIRKICDKSKHNNLWSYVLTTETFAGYKLKSVGLDLTNFGF